MTPFNINEYVKQRTEIVFGSKYSWCDGKYDFDTGLIPHTRLRSGIEIIQETNDFYRIY
jgi:hypothetical protein